MNKKKIETTLTGSINFLQANGIPYALIGGLAASIRGRMRATEDVDIVVHCTVNDAISLLAKLGGSLFEPLFPEVESVVRQSQILPILHSETGVVVDLAIGTSGFEKQVVSRATPVLISTQSSQVATAEDLILMKAIAGRPQDEQDILGIIITNKNDLDWDYCESTSRQLQDAIGMDLVKKIADYKSAIT